MLPSFLPHSSEAERLLGWKEGSERYLHGNSSHSPDSLPGVIAAGSNRALSPGFRSTSRVSVAGAAALAPTPQSNPSKPALLQRWARDTSLTCPTALCSAQGSGKHQAGCLSVRHGLGAQGLCEERRES